MFEQYRKLLKPESFLDVIDPKILRQLMEGFYYKQNKEMILLYVDPNAADETGQRFRKLHPTDGDTGIQEQFNPFCEKFRSSLDVRNKMCEECDSQHAFELIADPANRRRYSCHMGLFDFRYPITVAGRVLAVFLAGQRFEAANHDMREKILKNIRKKAPALENDLLPLLDNCAESLETINDAQKSFETFAAGVQSIIASIYESKLRQAMNEAVIEVSEVLGEKLETSAEDLAGPVSNVLDEATRVFSNGSLALFIRKQSRYRVLGSSGTTSKAITNLSLPVVDCIEFASNKWTTITPDNPLWKRLASQLECRVGKPLHFFKVITPTGFKTSLSVMLYADWDMPQFAQEFFGECTRVIAHVVNSALLLEKLQEQHKQFAISITHTGHQLKTPIQSALFSAYWLEKKADSGDITSKELREEAKRMRGRLIMGFMDAKTLQTARESTKALIDMQTLLNELLPVFERIGETRNIKLRLRCHSPKKLTVSGIETQLRVAFQNLLDNAVKYSFAGKEVIVVLDELKSHVLITISDYGVGFSKEEKEQLFHYGTRYAHHDTKVARHGVGIGLVQAKEILETHDGTIDIDSVPQVAESLGIRHLTIVRVTLPQSDKGENVR